MTRKEQLLNGFTEMMKGLWNNQDLEVPNLDTACKQEPCSDTVSRQAAIDALERKKDKNAKGDIGGFYNKIIQNDIDALMQLPSAQPEKRYTKADYIMALHKEYGYPLETAEKAHDAALEYLRSLSKLKG